MREPAITHTGEAPDEELLELLEPTLQDFVRLIGWQSTLDIVRVHGGTLLNVARKAERSTGLVELIGPERAAILGRHYGTERPYIPKAMELMRELRNRSIRKRYRTHSIKQLAQEYGLSIRTVFYIVRDAQEAEADPTLPLF